MEENKQNWFQKHIDTISIISTFIACFWFLNSKISEMEKDITVIKTVLCMQNIMPKELAVNEEK